VADSANKSHPHMYTSKEANLVTKFRGFFLRRLIPYPLNSCKTNQKETQSIFHSSSPIFLNLKHRNMLLSIGRRGRTATNQLRSMYCTSYYNHNMVVQSHHHHLLLLLLPKNIITLSLCQQRNVSKEKKSDESIEQLERSNEETSLTHSTLKDMEEAKRWVIEQQREIYDAITQEEFSKAILLLDEMNKVINTGIRPKEIREHEQMIITWKTYVMRQYATIYFWMKDYEQAVVYCDKTLALEKEIKRLRMSSNLFMDLNMAAVLKSEILIKRKQYDQALKIRNYLIDNRIRKRLANIKSDDPWRVILGHELAYHLIERAKLYMTLSSEAGTDYSQEALRDLNESLQILPTALAFLLKSRINFGKSQYRKALQNAKLCLEMNPDEAQEDEVNIIIEQCLVNLEKSKEEEQKKSSV
jgi:tetratricopeptide (TPR) repeat protein